MGQPRAVCAEVSQHGGPIVLNRDDTGKVFATAISALGAHDADAMPRFGPHFKNKPPVNDSDARAILWELPSPHPKDAEIVPFSEVCVDVHAFA